MIENNNAMAVNAFMAKLDHFKASIDTMNAFAKKLQDQNKSREEGLCFCFSVYMLGVYTIALKVKTYMAYPDKILPSCIDTIDLVHDQLTRCSAMQKEYSLHSKQGITVDYELILHKLEVLKDLIKTEQPDSIVLSDAAVDLLCVTLQANTQLMNDLSLKPKDQVAKEAKSESVSDK